VWAISAQCVKTVLFSSVSINGLVTLQDTVHEIGQFSNWHICGTYGQENAPKFVCLASKVGFISSNMKNLRKISSLCKSSTGRLRHCSTSWEVAGSIPDFSLTYSFRLHFGFGLDSFSNRNEYQDYFLVVKAAGA